MNLFSPRIGLRQLAGLSRRLSTSLEAGLDIRRVLQREAAGASPAALRRNLTDMSQTVAAGRSVTDAVGRTDRYFPALFRELVEVGEETGQLAEVLRHLAEHYEQQIVLRRTFLAGIAWPAIQLFAAVAIVGLLIWVLGLIGSLTGNEPIDVLGLGLVGNSGLAIYLLSIGSLTAAGVAVYQGARRGMFWAQPIERAVFRIPVLGESLKTLALARLAWTLRLTLETGMGLERALPLALRSTQTSCFTDHTADVVRAVRSGHEISEALAPTGAFPIEFLESLRVGEQSGRISETMELLSRQLTERAWAALRTLSLVASFAVWALVALVIIVVIFKLALFYIGTIYDAAQGRF